MQRSKFSYFFLGLAAVIAAAAVYIWVSRPGHPLKVPSANTPENAAAGGALNQAGDGESAAKKDPDKVLVDPGVGTSAVDPGMLVAQIAKALVAGDLAKVGLLIGKQALDSQTVARLKSLCSSPLRVRQPDGIREVGEMELNVSSRWAIELEGGSGIYLELRHANGKWKVEKISLPSVSSEENAEAATADSLGVADAFLQSVLKQNFQAARGFVDPAKVSDAKIAGLCILFEEGEYRLRKSKALRAMFQREDTVGYLANVETVDAKQFAQFAMTLKKAAESTSWLVSEINLDQLLAEYASRVAGGDLYYSPLVKNPNGGDTLALYFEFDEDQMHPRTRRQLEIVSMILRLDPGKKITLSGHTDALGTKDYNNDLSTRRADVVRDYLIQVGVAAGQIVTVAKGDSQPRRPNVTETGGDNPEGRRANRRTEIYLDF